MAQLNPQSKAFDFTKRKRWADLIITELSGVVMLVLTNSGKIMFCNEAAKELLNWREDIHNQTLFDYIHPDDSPVFQKQFHDCIRDPTAMYIYVRFKNLMAHIDPDSKEKWPIFEIKGHPHYASNNTPYGVPSSSNSNSECICFFAMARPYPTRGTSTFDSFLELKLENERLRCQLIDLRNGSYVPTAASTSTTHDLTMNDFISEEAGAPDTTFRNTTTSGAPLASSTDVAYPGIDFAKETPEDGNAKGRRHTIATGAEELDDAASKKKKRKASTAEHKYVCVTCGRTDSPEWRKGPLGPKTLCNACGLRHSKKAKKAPGEPEPPQQQPPTPQQTHQQRNLEDYRPDLGVAVPPPLPFPPNPHAYSQTQPYAASGHRSMSMGMMPPYQGGGTPVGVPVAVPISVNSMPMPQMQYQDLPRIQTQQPQHFQYQDDPLYSMSASSLGSAYPNPAHPHSAHMSMSGHNQH